MNYNAMGGMAWGIHKQRMRMQEILLKLNISSKAIENEHYVKFAETKIDKDIMTRIHFIADASIKSMGSLGTYKPYNELISIQEDVNNLEKNCNTLAIELEKESSELKREVLRTANENVFSIISLYGEALEFRRTRKNGTTTMFIFTGILIIILILALVGIRVWF